MLGEVLKGITGFASLGTDIMNYQSQKQANAIKGCN